MKGNHLLFRMEKDGELLRNQWLKGGKLLKNHWDIKEEYRGNLAYEISSVYKNRVFQKQHTIEVPWNNKELKIHYTTFRDKLEPGAKERWEVKISGPKGERVQSEMLMSMYDASLDALKPHDWRTFTYPTFYRKRGLSNDGFGRVTSRSYFSHRNANRLSERYMGGVNWYSYGLIGNYYGYRNRVLFGKYDINSARNGGFESEELAPSMNVDMDDGDRVDGYFNNGSGDMKTVSAWAENTPPANKPATVRKNLKETVFFYPDLKTDGEGNIVINFTMNESLTKWRLMSYAHTESLQQVYSEKEVVTQKELMVQPNPPRFLREGDRIEFTAKLSNLSDEKLNGKVRLEWLDAFTMKSLSGDWNRDNSQHFALDAKRNTKLSWSVAIPEHYTRPVVYRIVAESDRFADGEEAPIPVLSKRKLITESIPLYVKGKSSATASLKNLKTNSSSSLKHHKLTLELTENPAWYALQAMPYIMEYPHECSEQLFSRYYANSLAMSLMNSKPQIQRVFESWKNADVLQSSLHKNPELKNILLEETPWVMQAEDETKQKKRLGLLFDLNHMNQAQSRSLQKLMKNQLGDGSFPWFKGGRGNDYITRYIVEGMGHLKEMSVPVDGNVDQMLRKAISYIDGKAVEAYDKIAVQVKKGKTSWSRNHLSHHFIHYLYARSYFVKSHPLEGKNKDVHDYIISQAAKYWPKQSVYMDGMIALAMERNNREDVTKKIMASIKEKAVMDKELGLFWKGNGWHWYQLPIEQQALLIELLEERGEREMADDAKRWLLSQKRTQHWSTTKSTAAAVYALLMNGADWLEEGKELTVYMAGNKIDLPANKEAGTGYQKVVWDDKEIKTEMADLKIENPNPQPAWAAMHWQFFEDIDAVKASEKGPLQLEKSIYIERYTSNGVVHEKLEEGMSPKVGDKLRVRLELSTSQSMSYVHVKDGRASTLEPIQVLSQYKWGQGLSYYQAVGDAAMHFFIDYMPKGKYVVEYELRVTHEGEFAGGIAELECMYAPEFSGHSKGQRIIVKP